MGPFRYTCHKMLIVPCTIKDADLPPLNDDEGKYLCTDKVCWIRMVREPHRVYDLDG